MPTQWAAPLTSETGEACVGNASKLTNAKTYATLLAENRRCLVMACEAA